ncbi:MAG TPA: hypothetical protein VHE08_06535 [Solirubrobacterales bacterium]|nr:hypothetical protein [Solirubrobacterales bacterium]
MIEADGIRCSQVESRMVTPPFAGPDVGRAPAPSGRPKLFVCTFSTGLSRLDLAEAAF